SVLAQVPCEPSQPRHGREDSVGCSIHPCPSYWYEYGKRSATCAATSHRGLLAGTGRGTTWRSRSTTSPCWGARPRDQSRRGRSRQAIGLRARHRNYGYTSLGCIRLNGCVHVSLLRITPRPPRAVLTCAARLA